MKKFLLFLLITWSSTKTIYGNPEDLLDRLKNYRNKIGYSEILIIYFNFLY